MNRLLAPLLLLLLSCHTTRAPREAVFGGDPWSPSFTPPTLLTTERVRLEPLAPRHTERDHAAFMSSREHLRATLNWGEWPRADMTLEENRADLQRHWEEFLRREAYAYTVLSPDGTRCLGCVYINPPDEDAAAPEEDGRAATLAYWVTVEGLEQARRVRGMEANGGLIEHVEDS